MLNKPIYIGCDMDLVVKDLCLARTPDTLISNATIVATLYGSIADAVAGLNPIAGAVDLPLPPVVDEPGTYRGVLPATVTIGLTKGQSYWVKEHIVTTGGVSRTYDEYRATVRRGEGDEDCSC